MWYILNLWLLSFSVRVYMHDLYMDAHIVVMSMHMYTSYRICHGGYIGLTKVINILESKL